MHSVRRSRSVLLGIAAVAIFVTPMSAHHSFAMFDSTNKATITGTVTRFEWTNPHVFIELDVSDGNGGTKHYSIECASPNVLMRVGWKYSDVKKGDKVRVTVRPLKNGDPGGMLETATLADGRTLTERPVLAQAAPATPPAQ